MKIACIEVFQKSLPLGEPYEMAGMVLNALDATIIKLTSDTGLVGWGESCPLGPVYQPAHALGMRAAIAQMAPDLIGSDPLKIGVLHARMDALLAGQNYAKAAVDIAAHDLMGQHFGVPVCDLLGGAKQASVPSYVVIKGAALDNVLSQAEVELAKGYRRFQYKAGIVNLDQDVENLRALAGMLPKDAMLKADFNRGALVRDVVTFSQQLRDIALIVEQPCAVIEQHQGLRDRLCHPLYLDENTQDVNTVLSTLDMVDGFGLKITRLGGLYPMTTVRDICAARQMPHTCDDSFGGDIIAAACIHMGATVDPNCLDGVWVAMPYLDTGYGDNDLIPKDGFLTIPTGAGLGIQIDESRFGPVIARYE